MAILNCLLSHLGLLVLNSAICIGVWSAVCALRVDFDSVVALEKRVPLIVRRPLYGCPVCMSWLYGLPIFWALHGLSGETVESAGYVLALAGFNAIASAVVSR